MQHFLLHDDFLQKFTVGTAETSSMSHLSSELIVSETYIIQQQQGRNCL